MGEDDVTRTTAAMMMPYGIGFYWGHPISGAAQILGRGAKFRLSVIGDLVFTDVRTSFVLMFINKLEIVNCGNELEGGVQQNLSETM